MKQSFVWRAVLEGLLWDLIDIHRTNRFKIFKSLKTLNQNETIFSQFINKPIMFIAVHLLLIPFSFSQFIVLKVKCKDNVRKCVCYLLLEARDEKGVKSCLHKFTPSACLWATQMDLSGGVDWKSDIVASCCLVKRKNRPSQSWGQ